MQILLFIGSIRKPGLSGLFFFYLNSFVQSKLRLFWPSVLLPPVPVAFSRLVRMSVRLRPVLF